MRIRALLLASALGFASAVLLPGPGAQAQAPTALTGTVTSQQEGRMEGVLVSAKKAGGTITITVVSDADGKFTFPASKLEPGDYVISIRAIGFDLDGPQQVKVGTAPTTADVKLVKTKNLSKQMSNGEWIASVPGTQQQKLSLLNCVSCHSVERIVKSSYDKDSFATQILPRMGSYANQSTPLHIQKRMATRLLEERGDSLARARPAGGVPQLDQPERKRRLGVRLQGQSAPDRPRHQGHLY
jgi:virginiamycin B lyase